MIQTAQLQDKSIQYWSGGEGRTLLLVHGFPLDYSMWSGQLQPLSSVCHVLAPDLVGFGGSSRIGDDAYSMEQFAIDLRDLLDQLEINQRVVFCGLSMGGYIAWQFWQHFADRLEGLVLCDTRAAADSQQVARGRLYMAQRVVQDGPVVAATELMQKLFSPTTHEQSPEYIETIRDVIMRTPPSSIAAAQRGMAARPDMTSKLSEIELPTLLICGQDDVITQPEEMKQMAESIPGAIYQEIPAAGHMSPLENAKEVNLILQRYLTETFRP